MFDRYTKAVLTVIAAALVGLVVQNSIRPVGAAGGVQAVVICDPIERGRCARVFQPDEFSNKNNYLFAGK